MTDAEKNKLKAHLKTLREMLYDKEKDVNFYSAQSHGEASEIWKTIYKDMINKRKAEYEAIDYATEIIIKELSEVEE